MADRVTNYPFLLWKPLSSTVSGFVLDDLTISEVEPFVPRISESREQTDLDTTLLQTFPVTHGFSKTMSDDNKNYRVVGNYNPVDGNLYPKLPYSSAGSTGATHTGSSGYVSAKVSTYNATYIAIRDSTVNRLYKITSASCCCLWGFYRYYRSHLPQRVSVCRPPKPPDFS